MSVSLKNAVRIASMAIVSLRVKQLAVTLKETMADGYTKKESWRKNTIHTMHVNVMCATCGRRNEQRKARDNRGSIEAIGRILDGQEIEKPDRVLTVKEAAADERKHGQ